VELAHNHSIIPERGFLGKNGATSSPCSTPDFSTFEKFIDNFIYHYNIVGVTVEFSL